MDHYFVHGLGLVFYFFLLWLLLQLCYAAWGLQRAAPQWIALVKTPLMRRIGIKWLAPVLTILTALQILLVVFMLGISAWTGNPIRFE